ncbi:MAG: class I SAM-dependent methyltransferase [Blautia sp.]|nr:class I SAM-dependent methyltransferase [Blautia sp.]
MFWDRVAPVYDVFVNLVNPKAHERLKELVKGYIGREDEVLECACGSGLLTMVMAGRCRHLTATDFSLEMLKRAKKNCEGYPSVTFLQADITALPFESGVFDKVVAANVIHLLEDPGKALEELSRVCKPGGLLLIPTYMNRSSRGKTSLFASAVGRAGADFKRQFTVETYRDFFIEKGYPDVEISLAEGRIPCALAVVKKEQQKTD